MIIIRYFFSLGAGCCFWAANDGADKLFGIGAIENNALPISDDLVQKLNNLCERFDTSIDWDYPPTPSPWSDAEHESFKLEADTILEKIRLSLGSNYQIMDER